MPSDSDSDGLVAEDVLGQQGSLPVEASTHGVEEPEAASVSSIPARGICIARSEVRVFHHQT